MSMSDVFDALPDGYTMLEYRIESTLGVGGFGVTYLAHDANLNTKVAIKEYLPSDFARRCPDHSIQPKSNQAREPFDWGLKRFLEESRILASFRHPNIVRVMRFFEANSTAYMVMEFIAGKPLRRTNLDQAGVLRIAMPLLDGLDVIHQSGYLHRDIKPPNIFIRNDGSPILIDFGSARMSVTVNQEMTAIVSPGFSPLEQYHSHGKQGPWTDIYSFAGVLYWLVTGNKPVEAAARAHQDTMPAAAAIGDTRYYGREFLKAIDWALRPLEGDRPQSVAEWRSALVTMESVELPTTPLDGARPTARATPRPVREEVRAPAVVASDVGFEREFLTRIQGALAASLGPIAAVVVRNAARKSATVAELVALLAAEISDERARAAFTATFNRDPAMPVSRLVPRTETTTTSLFTEQLSTTQLQKFDPEILRQAETALAIHIGAVARIVLKRAVPKARDENELYLLLSDEIDDEAARKNFVRSLVSFSRKR